MRGTSIRRNWAWDPELYAPPKYRKACSYDAFLPDSIADFDESLPSGLLGVVSDAESAIHSLNDRARPALKPLARLLLRTESIASSKVEGLQIDARDLARAEVNAETGKRPGPVAAEILSNIDAMELAIEDSAASQPLALDQVIDIHRLLLSNAPNSQIAGQLRHTQNWIGGNDYNPCGASFVPPPPENVLPLLDDLVAFTNSDRLPPVIQAALAHAQFEAIHPFLDGNGRTGRALTQIVLRRRGTGRSYVPPISVVLAEDKSGYINGLTEFRHGNVAAWIEHFAVTIVRAASLASMYLVEVETLKARWGQQLSDHRAVRADAAAWTIIEQLPGYPVITLPVATAATARSKSSTAVGIDLLVEAGVLVPLSESKRNQSWEANGLLDLLASLEQASG